MARRAHPRRRSRPGRRRRGAGGAPGPGGPRRRPALGSRLPATDAESRCGTVAAPLAERLFRRRRPRARRAVLVTGGARGITAAVVADLARRWRPTSAPGRHEPVAARPGRPDHVGRTSAGRAQGDPARSACAAGRPVGPAELERATRPCAASARSAPNLRALREAGATVEYAQVDVRDADATRPRRSPAGSGGSGRRRPDPRRGGDPGQAAPRQDARVVRPRARHQARRGPDPGPAARPEPLRFAAFFSSVAGRFGNRGQSDYAAANEALNKLAIWLDRRWPGRVVSMIWGPWSGVGMVSDLEGHLGRRGPGDDPARRRPLAPGRRAALGRKGDVEVIVAGDLGTLGRARRTTGRRRAQIASDVDGHD